VSKSTARGLGRGLASLIPDSALDLDLEQFPNRKPSLRVVPIDEIKANPEQPRQVFEPDDLAQLADSITAHGVLTPLVVRRHEGRYVLIAGERRLRASALAGMTEVPVIVRDADDPSEQLELALVENLQRVDLDPVEAARGFQRLIDDYGYTQEAVAQRVGKNRATVANAVRLLKLPAYVLDVLRDGRISAGHARAMLPLGDADELRRVVARVIAEGMSVRATERLVNSIVKVRTVRGRGERSRERTLEYATKLLEDSLRTSVSIKPRRNGSGRIVIDYSDSEELERLITTLREDTRAG
jgi:ParB family chromosome partitioning protein